MHECHCGATFPTEWERAEHVKECRDFWEGEHEALRRVMEPCS